MDNNLQTNSVLPKNKMLGAVLVLVVLLLLAAAAAVFLGKKKMMPVSDGYQAVFLSNGQVYFGKLSHRGPWVMLEDIYYLQVTQQLQPAGSDANAQPNQPAQQTPPASQQQQQNAQPNIQLVKLGSELHGPEDAMYIDKDKVLFWENMKSDSKVVQAIGKYKETH